MELIKPYTSEFFNSLPGLGDSSDSFRSNDGNAAVDSAFQDLFVRHKMTKLFGLGLVHRHFDLKPNELLVDVNGTSTAWGVPDLPEAPVSAEYQKHHGRIRPHSWTVDGERLAPYEFYYEPDFSSGGLNFEGLATVDPQFLREFIDLLKIHKLSGVLGLRLLRELNGRQLEVTERAANVTFDVPDDLTPENGSQYLEAAWMFRDEAVDGDGKPVTKRYCYSTCTSPSGWSHVQSHVRVLLPSIFSTLCGA